MDVIEVCVGAGVCPVLSAWRGGARRAGRRNVVRRDAMRRMSLFTARGSFVAAGALSAATAGLGRWAAGSVSRATPAVGVVPVVGAYMSGVVLLGSW
jgi:hypothetical protein